MAHPLFDVLLPSETGPAPYRNIPPAELGPAPMPASTPARCARRVLGLDTADIDR